MYVFYMYKYIFTYFVWIEKYIYIFIYKKLYLSIFKYICIYAYLNIFLYVLIYIHPGILIYYISYCCCCCLVIQSCPDSAALWTAARHVSLSMQFSKQEYWSGLPCPPPGDLPDSGTGHVILYHLTTWKVHISCKYILLYILNIFPTSRDFDVLYSQGLGSYSVWEKKKKAKLLPSVLQAELRTSVTFSPGGLGGDGLSP